MKTSLTFTPSISPLALPFVVIVALVAFGAPLRAQDVWVGNGVTQNWSDGNNWQSGTPPVSDDDIQFQGSNNTSPNQDFGAGFPVVSVTFNSNAASFDLVGNAIGFFAIGGSNTIENDSPTDQTFDLTNNGGVGGAGIVFGGVPGFINATNGNIIINCNIELENFGGGADLTFDGAFKTTVNGSI